MGIQTTPAADIAGQNVCSPHNDDSPERVLKPNERLIYDALKRADKPMKAYALLDVLREEGVRAPMTVYRALDTLIDKGCVKKITSLNAYIASPTCRGGPATAFVICKECGATRQMELDSGLVTELLGVSKVSAQDLCVEAYVKCDKTCEA